MIKASNKRSTIILVVDHLHNSTKINKELYYYLFRVTETLPSVKKQVFSTKQQGFLTNTKYKY